MSLYSDFDPADYAPAPVKGCPCGSKDVRAWDGLLDCMTGCGVEFDPDEPVTFHLAALPLALARLRADVDAVFVTDGTCAASGARQGPACALRVRMTLPARGGWWARLAAGYAGTTLLDVTTEAGDRWDEHAPTVAAPACPHALAVAA